MIALEKKLRKEIKDKERKQKKGNKERKKATIPAKSFMSLGFSRIWNLVIKKFLKIFSTI